MPTKINTLLVDDEPLALDYLRELLKAESDFEVVGQCRNGREALKVLGEGAVDLVFMDVQMPGMTGLEVIAEVQADILPMVVFATAYDEYAFTAFELNAVDYLLKPIDPERLASALQRCRDRYISQALLRDKGNVVSALNQMRRTDSSLESADKAHERNKLPIKDGGQTYLVPFTDIDWIDAAGDYMCVHAEGQTHILRSTMKELEQRLPGYFVRIHRSTIVNLNKVRTVEALPKGESLLHLGDEVTLKVSRNFRAGIQHLIAS